MGVREPDISDVLQDVFLIVHRKLDGFEGRSSLRTWLYGISYRVVADYRKRAYRHREIPGDLQKERSAPQTSEARVVLADLLMHLSDERRDLVVMYEVEGLSMREAADVLKIPLQTAYSRHKAAISTLRGLVQDTREGRSRD